MICDKCGFEHNSRSVCPKCGARVVYVNEDYERRRKEWEEAQKNPEKKDQMDQILSGIMYSTREEYDRRHGNDTVTELDDKFQGDGRKNRKEKGRSEMTGLSFAVIKEKAENAILRAAEWLASFIRRHKKRRGSDNPVIRELKFDDSADDFDSSPAVAEHKVFHRVRRPVLLAAGCMAGAAVIGTAAFSIAKAVKNRDRSRIFVYDGTYGYFADDEKNHIITPEDGSLTVDMADNGRFLAHSENNIVMLKNGEKYIIDAPDAVITAYDRNLNTVVYKEGGVTMVTDGKMSKELDFDDAFRMESDVGYTDSCAVSPDGSYIFLVTCRNSEDKSSGEQTIYFGTADDGIKAVKRGPDSINVISVSNDGTAVYEDMEAAAYGIVNSRNLVCMSVENESIIAENINSVQYDYINDIIYYIDNDNNLCLYRPAGDGQSEHIAGNVTGMMMPGLSEYDGGMVFNKGESYYYTFGEVDENETIETYYMSDFTDEPRTAVSRDGEFWYLDGSVLCRKETGDQNSEIVSENVTYASVAGNSRCIYLSDGILYYTEKGENREIDRSACDIWQTFVSGKKIYYVDGNGILRVSDLRGKKKTALGQVKNVARLR